MDKDRIPTATLSGRLKKENLSEEEIRLIETAIKDHKITKEQLEQALSEKRQNPKLQIVQIFLRKQWLNTQDYVQFLTQTDSEKEQTEPALDNAKTLIEPEAKDKKFGNYLLLKKLGQGGMSIVFKAVEQETKQTVALKILISGKAATGDEKRRFYQEINAMKRLQHTNIVHIYDIGEVKGTSYYTMDYIKGNSLKDLGGNLSFRDAASLMQKICMAVQHAHEANIIHRDIKPENILIAEDGMPFLTDFGLAKDLSEYASLTGSGICIGTPLYMSPEQAKGKSKYASFASDIYSLGATFYYLVTGRHPFMKENFVDLIESIVYHDPPNPSSVNPKLPPEADWIILWAMHKQPQRRYCSAMAMAEDLSAYLEDKPLVTAHRRLKLTQWIDRQFAVASIAALVVVITLLYFLLRGQSRHDTKIDDTKENKSQEVTTNKTQISVPSTISSDHGQANMNEFRQKFTEYVCKEQFKEAVTHCDNFLGKNELSTNREQVLKMQRDAVIMQMGWEHLQKRMLEQQIRVPYKSRVWAVKFLTIDKVVLQRLHTTKSVAFHQLDLEKVPMFDVRKAEQSVKFWRNIGLIYFYREEWENAQRYLLIAKQGKDMQVDEYLQIIAVHIKRDSTKGSQDHSSNRHSFKEAFIEDVKQMDKNGDGKISREEWEKPHGVFDKLDRNRDGYLSQEDQSR